MAQLNINFGWAYFFANKGDLSKKEKAPYCVTSTEPTVSRTRE